MYEAVTRDVCVRVEPEFDEARSDPSQRRYFWLYHVEIQNQSQDAVRLVTRHWEITDARGHRECVDGPGVVGKMPVIGPGETFSYTSGCPLTTPSGIMVGRYEMVLTNGDNFSCVIPAFSLDSPGSRPTLN